MPSMGMLKSQNVLVMSDMLLTDRWLTYYGVVISHHFAQFLSCFFATYMPKVVITSIGKITVLL